MKRLSQPKTYVGSEVCKTCHLEHYDAWKRTLHSKMLQDVSKNEDVLVVELDQEVMKEDFKKIEKKLKIPVDQVYFPKREDVQYTIGSQWKQRYLVQKDGTYYIAPTQFNIDTGRWVNYHEKDWDKRPVMPPASIWEKRPFWSPRLVVRPVTVPAHTMRPCLSPRPSRSTPPSSILVS